MGSTDTSGQTAALEQSKKSWDKYNSEYDTYKGQYEAARKNAENQWARDYGGSAGEYMDKANKAGIQSANQQLTQGAKAATAATQKASRSAGLTKGQAAMNAAGAAGNLYNQQWGGAVNQGKADYGNAVNMGQSTMLNQQNSAANLMGNATQGQAGASNIAATVGNAQTSEWDRNMGLISGAGGIVSGFGSIMGSDERMKQHIKRLSVLKGGKT